jgi:ribosomal protein S12 methylthiotransferase accessory factor
LDPSDNSLPTFAEFMASGPASVLPVIETVRRIMARRSHFGITRLGSITGLDHVGVPVVQVIRPEALSNAVTQGKGWTAAEAAIAALMEALETWAAERISPERTWRAVPEDCSTADIWAELWRRRPGTDPLGPIAWIEGWDIMRSGARPVPLALVDTVYTLPSPHAEWLPRDTTGLAAGTDVSRAVRHGCLEVLERDARCSAVRTPHFFDRHQIATRSVISGRAGAIVRRLRHSGLATGIWSIPTAHALPVYWCHVMPAQGRPDLAPLPAEGFGCDTSHDAALAKALLEACQARLTAIAGAREDVTANLYREGMDRAWLADWRKQLDAKGAPLPVDNPVSEAESELDRIIEAMRAAGARAALAVPLFIDMTIPLAVVRMVAPPLRTNPEEAGDGA